VSRLAFAGLAALVLLGFGAYVLQTEPTWYQRVRYPLRYEQIVTGHAANYRRSSCRRRGRGSPTAPAATPGSRTTCSTRS
jgi:hypothetical protein